MPNIGYEYDVFISYRRTDPVGGWVHNHFFPLLEMWLRESFPPGRHPRIYIDKKIEAGAEWDESLRYALLRSRCLVSVWSPQYFGREWCLAEWRSMRERERILRQRDNPKLTLVYPVKFNDGDSFPPQETGKVQYNDLSMFNCPFAQFKNSVLYLDFDRKMREVAEDVARIALAAPEWEAGWPLVDVLAPSPLTTDSATIPLLRLT